MYRGIFSKYCIELERLNIDEIQVKVEPNPEGDLAKFKTNFVDEYLNKSVEVEEMY